MAVNLHYGMDHQHYQWSPLNQQREHLRWPNGARVAVCVIITLEHMEWNPPLGTYQNPALSGGYGASPFPDVTRWSHREYGHRVGIFRLLDLLRKHGLKPTVAMDVLTAQNYPLPGSPRLQRRRRDRGNPIASLNFLRARQARAAKPGPLSVR
jgi:hypothetical protein